MEVDKSSRFYRTYKSMVARCTQPKQKSYARYGAKGVKVLWDSFEEFYNDMYESYKKHIEEFGEKDTTIDRVDPKGNYCKENCRWATLLEQARNKNNNVVLTYNEKSMSIQEWAEELGMSFHTITTRYSRGWSVERILQNKRFNRFGKLLSYEFNGETHSLREWSKVLGIKYGTLYGRIVLRKLPLEESFTTPV